MKLSKNFVISAVSNLSTAYNLLVINVVHVLVVVVGALPLARALSLLTLTAC